jgi:3-hydroxyisobutyrate dehydrogenase-like beta-hydroxyacid dehydrogenase
MEEIGVIGLGLLGSAIVERLLRSGFEVCGFDIDDQRRANGRGLGARVIDSAPAVARQCSRILLSLPNSNIVGGVIDEILPHLRRGAIVLDTTTGDPEQSATFAEQLARHATTYLEANVGGSSQQVRNADAIVICGGDRTAYAACTDVFGAFSRQSFYMGNAGCGNRMKLVMNLVLGLHRAVLAEGLAFAQANGIDPQSALEVLKAGPAYSRAMDTKGEKMVTRDFSAQARLSQHLKDVRLILEVGERCAAVLPLSTVHCELLRKLENAGFGSEDNSAVIRAFR